MSDIGSSKFIFHQIHAMEFTNCLSAFDGRRHDTMEATTMTAEQLFNRKFLKKTSMQPYVNTRMFLLRTYQTLI